MSTKKMNHNYLFIFFTLLVFNSCNILKQSADSNNETIGHFTMGVLDYSILDSLVLDSNQARLIVDEMRPDLEYALIFSSKRSARVINTEGEYITKSIFDRPAKTLFSFAYTDSISYFSEMNIGLALAEFNKPPSDENKSDKRYKVTPANESNESIFGFKCERVELFKPPEYIEVVETMIVCEKVPHMLEAVSPLLSFYSGAPLRSTIQVDGVKITLGAVDYKENPAMAKHLTFDPSKLQEISVKELKAMNAKKK